MTRIIVPVVLPVLLAVLALVLLGRLTAVEAAVLAVAVVAASLLTAWSAARLWSQSTHRPSTSVRESLDAELQRARRLDTPLAVVRLGVEADRAVIADHLRATDIVVAGTEDVFVLMPGEDTAGAEQWLTRLQVRPVEFTAASFPTDALTVDSLLEAVATSPSVAEPRRRRRSA